METSLECFGEETLKERPYPTTMIGVSPSMLLLRSLAFGVWLSKSGFIVWPSKSVLQLSADLLRKPYLSLRCADEISRILWRIIGIAGRRHREKKRNRNKVRRDKAETEEDVNDRKTKKRRPSRRGTISSRKTRTSSAKVASR